MKYQEQNIHAANADVVLRMYSDQDYFLTKYRNVGATEVKVLACTQGDGRFSITTSRQVAVEAPVPAFASKLVPSHITVIQTDSWDLAAKTGTLDIEFKGVPVNIHCDMKLTDQGSQCIQDLDFTLKVSVPLIGGKLEQLLADDLRRKFVADAAEARRALAAYLA